MRALEQREQTMVREIRGKHGRNYPSAKGPQRALAVWGRSPNAGGVSREKRELIDVARERSPAALDKIFAIMNDETVPPAVQLVAAGMILDRGYGKPRQMIETGDRGRTLEEMLREIWEAREAETQERAEGDQAG